MLTAEPLKNPQLISYYQRPLALVVSDVTGKSGVSPTQYP
jgi:hypothetical protein